MRRLAIAGSFLLVSLTSTLSSAYDALMCGATHLGIDVNTTFFTDQCNVPPGSAAEADFQNATYTWNKLRGVYDRFGVALGNTNCAAVSLQGNNRSDYQHQQNLGGLVGLAWYTGYPSGTCSDAEWDVLTANGPTQGVPPVATNGIYMRTILVHELGHVLGAAHETSGLNTFPASMAAFQPGPVIGGGSGGIDRSGVMGDDMLFARAYHGVTDSSSDVAASAWIRNGQAHSLPVPPNGGFQWGCAGTMVTYKGTVFNKGNAYVSTKLYVYLSLNESITTNDVLVQTWTFSANPGWSTTLESSFPIPSSLTEYTNYKIGIFVDPLNEVNEVSEANNTAFFFGTGVMRTPC
jgi:CARDB protein